MVSQQPLAYERTVDAEWVNGVNADPAPWTRGQEIYIKAMTCPTCKHDMQLYVPCYTAETFELLHEGIGVGRGPDAPPPAEAVCACNCEQDHPHRPDGKYGCGRWGQVAGPGNPSQDVAL